jgi:hypothetical protein
MSVCQGDNQSLNSHTFIIELTVAVLTGFRLDTGDDSVGLWLLRVPAF